MNTGELMTQGVLSCGPDDSLNDVAKLMWDHDCGCVPVVDGDGRAIGMITDRDICMAAYTQGKPLSHIRVWSAASHGVVSAAPEESIDATERLMQKHQIRRVPVVDGGGRPVGILSMNDLARYASRAEGRRTDGLSSDAIVQTLAAVSQPTPSHARAG